MKNTVSVIAQLFLVIISAFTFFTAIGLVRDVPEPYLSYKGWHERNCSCFN